MDHTRRDLLRWTSLSLAAAAWPSDGVPDRPAAWLMTVAHRGASLSWSWGARYSAGLEAATVSRFGSTVAGTGDKAGRSGRTGRATRSAAGSMPSVWRTI